MTAIGRTTWAIAGGRMPLESTGPEPELTSRDTLCLLNASDQDAAVEIMLHYEGREPVGPYRLRLRGQRVRHVRVNDLIDPAAPPLDAAYAAVIRADVPIVVQFSRLDSRQAANAITGTMAFPAGD